MLAQGAPAPAPRAAASRRTAPGYGLPTGKGPRLRPCRHPLRPVRSKLGRAGAPGAALLLADMPTVAVRLAPGRPLAAAGMASRPQPSASRLTPGDVAGVAAAAAAAGGGDGGAAGGQQRSRSAELDQMQVQVRVRCGGACKHEGPFQDVRAGSCAHDLVSMAAAAGSGRRRATESAAWHAEQRMRVSRRTPEGWGEDQPMAWEGWPQCASSRRAATATAAGRLAAAAAAGPSRHDECVSACSRHTCGRSLQQGPASKHLMQLAAFTWRRS